MAKCSFCGRELEKGTGKMLIRNDAKIIHYCSSKCEKNTNLGRLPRKTSWVRKKKK